MGREEVMSKERNPPKVNDLEERGTARCILALFLLNYISFLRWTSAQSDIIEITLVLLMDDLRLVLFPLGNLSSFQGLVGLFW